MRLGIFVGVATLVLITLVSAFPQMIVDSSNTSDHMTFTRELADGAARLQSLKSQHDDMASRFAVVPEKIARIEERLNLLSQMVWAILGGILALLAKEIWDGMRILRNRRSSNGNGSGGVQLQ